MRKFTKIIMTKMYIYAEQKAKVNKNSKTEMNPK